jgi:hypothetical protein
MACAGGKEVTMTRGPTFELIYYQQKMSGLNDSMRRDPLLIDEPVEVGGRALGARISAIMARRAVA